MVDLRFARCHRSPISGNSPDGELRKSYDKSNGQVSAGSNTLFIWQRQNPHVKVNDMLC